MSKVKLFFFVSSAEQQSEGRNCIFYAIATLLNAFSEMITGTKALITILIAGSKCFVLCF